MCRMNFIQDAHEKDEKSDQPCVRKMLVSQLGWSSSGHHSLGHLLICSPIFCGGACIEDAAPCASHICELLFCVCRCCSGAALHLLCSSARLAERVLGEYLHSLE